MLKAPWEQVILESLPNKSPAKGTKCSRHLSWCEPKITALKAYALLSAGVFCNYFSPLHSSNTSGALAKFETLDTSSHLGSR